MCLLFHYSWRFCPLLCWYNLLHLWNCEALTRLRMSTHSCQYRSNHSVCWTHLTLLKNTTLWSAIFYLKYWSEVWLHPHFKKASQISGCLYWLMTISNLTWFYVSPTLTQLLFQNWKLQVCVMLCVYSKMKPDYKLEQRTEIVKDQFLLSCTSHKWILRLSLWGWFSGWKVGQRWRVEKLKIKSHPRPVLFPYDKLAHKTLNVSPAHICELNLKSFNTATISPLVLT